MVRKLWGRHGGWAIRVLLAVLWAAALLAALWYGPSVAQIQEWLAQSGTAGPLLYIGAYVVAVFALLPRPALNAAGGLLFGLTLGLLLALAGGMLSALAQFFFARYVAHNAVERLLSEGVRTKLDRLVHGRGLLTTVQLRLVPVIPYQAVNYGFGLTSMPTWHFTLGTFLGSIPVTLAFVLVGAGGTGLGPRALLGGAVLVALLGVVWWVWSPGSRSEAAVPDPDPES